MVVPDDEEVPQEGGIGVRVAMEVTNAIDEGAPHGEQLPLFKEPLQTPVVVAGHHLQGNARSDCSSRSGISKVLLARGEGDRVLHVPEQDDEIGFPLLDAGEDTVKPPPGLARDVDPVHVQV